MNRFLILIASLLALTGCTGLDLTTLADPAVRVVESVTDENTSTAKGVTAGMSSSDAANVIMNRDYYNAVKAVNGADKKNAQPILEIEAVDGKPITIYAKSVKVYAPAGGGGGGVQIAAPLKLESAGIQWFREGSRALADFVLPWRQSENEHETRRLGIVTDANTTTFIQRENNSLMRDLVGTRNDPAAIDRAEADKIRIEATPTTTAP